MTPCPSKKLQYQAEQSEVQSHDNPGQRPKTSPEVDGIHGKYQKNVPSKNNVQVFTEQQARHMYSICMHIYVRGIKVRKQGTELYLQSLRSSTEFRRFR
ncbi:hypothetical protein SAY86_025792 [Trapa natans]|uniref:Uncharacterized protein n=1 Tax=Trapa natans TaxID=22666 RepID=A0AAN7QDW6_TRANT|nr:hypothetical protein SAY86_025792 [Trapa natans]